jgi:hypothetical protein
MRLGGPHSWSGCCGVTNENFITEKIKSTLNSDNARYHSFKKLSSSYLLSINVKINTQKTIILPVVVYGCETRQFTLLEEHKLSVSDNRVLKGIFGTKRNEIGGWRKLRN